MVKRAADAGSCLFVELFDRVLPVALFTLASAHGTVLRVAVMAEDWT